MQRNEIVQWEDLDITSDFMFGKIMQDKKLCLELLRRVFPEFRIKDIHVVEVQKEIRSGARQKYVRLDVYANDGIRRYDVEMQMQNYKSLSKRTRYYHSMIDADSILKGEKYSKLKDTYVIVFCPFDRFRAGRCIYTFENVCLEEDDIKLNDGNFTIFINSKGRDRDDIPEKLRNFLDLMEGKEDTEDPFIREVREAVQKAKLRDEWRQEYMRLADLQDDWFEEGREQGLEEGRKEGREEGREEGILQTLVKLVRKGRLSLDEAIVDSGLSKEEFMTALEQYKVSELTEK